MDLTKNIKGFIKKLPVGIGPMSMLILAASIVFLALALSTFTIQVSLFRKELPHALDRIDRQISEVQNMMNSSEKTGQNFQTGVNKGIGQGIVDVPLSTVANVGYKLSDTAASTRSQTLGIWGVIRDKVFFWQAKKTSTSEAKPKK